MNHICSLLLVSSAIVLVFESTAQAQRVYGRRWYRTPFRAGWGWGVRGGYWGGYQVGYPGRGIADIIRSRGQAAENYSRARINQQTANSKYLDNQRKWLHDYQERKRISAANRQARKEEGRARNLRYQAALKKRKPERLSASQLDPHTGKLDWPDALKSPRFFTLRKELDQLFALRASTRNSTGTNQKIFEKSRKMQSLLKDKIRDMPSSEYIAARKFLGLLVREFRASS